MMEFPWVLSIYLFIYLFIYLSSDLHFLVCFLNEGFQKQDNAFK